MLRCAEVPGIEGEVLNLGTGVEVSIGALAERVLALTGRRVPIVTAPDRLRPATSELERLVCDAAMAETLLGWHHHVDLDEGLGRTLEWFDESLTVSKPSIYNV